jgi:cob(I)alamin adenosyltransferase
MMPLKRRPRSKPIPKIRVRKGSAINVTRAEFDAVIKLLNERGEIINDIRRELHSTCRDLASQVEKNRHMLEIQFTRIAQLQQEIDALKRRA